MPFIPHTEQDVAEMLAAIGVSSLDALFDEIPADLRASRLAHVPAQRSEWDVARIMRDRAARDGGYRNFIGAGAYEHHIPAAVWEITTRGEFYSAYTPYQAEASQGTLQLLYEYQSMMVALTGMDVSNASMYDGASALAEAVLMAVRANRKSQSRRVLMPSTVHPHYRAVVQSIVRNQGIEIELVDYDRKSGTVTADRLPAQPGDFNALVIPMPNFFGALEDVHALTDWAHGHDALVIAVVNPTALALLTPPGEWGGSGADIVCGDGQPLGVPLSSGGPYFGFLCCKDAYIRQMPGRLVGRTVDMEGKPGFALTLQAREQHIRRSKATSNICTNQGLLVTAATIYMSLLGGEGMNRVARASHAGLQALLARLKGVAGVTPRFSAPCFHEAVIQLNKPAEQVLARMAAKRIVGGIGLDQYYPELENCVSVCVTETKSETDLDDYVAVLSEALKA